MGEEDGGSRTPEESKALLKKALLGILIILIVLYIILWAFGILASAWTGIISGLFLIVILVLALVERYR